MESIYLRINSDGKTQCVREVVSEVDISETIINRLSENLTIKVPNAFVSRKLNVNMTISNKECVLHCILPGLVIASPFSLHDDGILRPVFISRSELTNELIQAKLYWKTPNTMQLIFAARVRKMPDGVGWAAVPKQNFLIAYDPERRAYRMPLPNIYEDCTICTGDFSGVDSSLSGVFEKCMTQFENSGWNADLMGGRRSLADKIFMWKPTEDKSDFVQLPINEDIFDWRTTCQKVSTATTNLFI